MTFRAWWRLVIDYRFLCQVFATKINQSINQIKLTYFEHVYQTRFSGWVSTVVLEDLFFFHLSNKSQYKFAGHPWVSTCSSLRYATWSWNLHNQLRLQAPHQMWRIILRRRFNERAPPHTHTHSMKERERHHHSPPPPLPCAGLKPRFPPLPSTQSQLLCYATAATMGHCRFMRSAFCPIVQLCKRSTAAKFKKKKFDKTFAVEYVEQ